MNPLILKKGREKSLRRRHPWIFSGAVEKANGKVLKRSLRVLAA